MTSYASYIVRHRRLVFALSLLVTVLLGLQLKNLKIIVDADELLPKKHPFVEVTERVQSLFGNRFTVVIGITPKSGDVYTPDILNRVLKVTNTLVATPGVTPGNIQSLAAPRVKDIVGDDGGLVVKRMLEQPVTSVSEAQEVKRRLARNPAYQNVLVSADGRTAAIYAEFKKDPAGFSAIMAKVQAAVAPIRGPGVTITIAGQPAFLGALEVFSARIGILLPIAFVLIGLIHLEAFRTAQGLFLPLVTAILSLVWSLGVMTLFGIHLDPFNNITPLLILAVAAGHAVQVLKRYYEEYDLLRLNPELDPREASRRAVEKSMVKVGPVMIAAGLIAALSFMSLLFFDIQSIRTFGAFCGLGIISVVVVELTFTPALRALLPPPSLREAAAEQKKTAWDAVTQGLARQASSVGGRRATFVVCAVVCAVLAYGASLVRVDNSLRGFFGSDIVERRDDSFLNRAIAGTNTFYVLIEGNAPDAIKDPAVLRGMDRTEAWLSHQPGVGHALSIVDMLKQIHNGMNAGKTPGVLPLNRDLISQYLLLYSISGEPGDFDGLVDYPYQNAIIQTFVKTDSSAFVEDLNARILPVIKANFPPTVRVRLGGSITTPTAMNEVMVAGKLRNIGQIMLAVFVISAVLFRSPTMAFLILVPLAMTTLAVFGVMGFGDIPLQIATSTMSALAIGIGADYAVYLAYRLREELKIRPTEQEAIAVAFASAGKAVLFVASAVAGGYCVLMASLGFNVHIWLGLLTVVSMAVGAMSTLTLFAALLIAVRPRVIFPRAQDERPGLSGQAAVGGAAASIFLAFMAASFVGAHPGRAQPANAAPRPGADASELMAESLLVTKTAHSKAIGRFVLTNAAGETRVRDTSSVTELKPDGVNNRRIVRFNSPPDVSGTSVLTIENGGADDDIWVYLPALKKGRRLTASNKKDAFVGTDFSYGDVIGHPVAEWTHKLLRSEMLDGVPTEVVESLPKTPSVTDNTGYSRRISWLRSADGVPLKAEYYGAGGALMKVYTASDIRLVDRERRRYQAMRQTMRNVQTGHTTVIEYSSFTTNLTLPADQFLPRALERPF